MAACGTSEDSVSNTEESAADSTTTNIVVDDSSKAINHGSPEQEQIDSLKKVKQEKNKKK